MDARNCYVGLVLFGTVGDAVASLRDRISEAFGAPRSNSPPHLTLFSPFLAHDVPLLAAAIGSVARSRTPFEVPIAGYDAFDASVWFLRAAADPALLSLRQHVRDAIRGTLRVKERSSRVDSPFHVTIAKKYDPEAHERIGAYIRGDGVPAAALPVDHLALFHRPSGAGRWGPIEIFFFGS